MLAFHTRLSSAILMVLKGVRLCQVVVWANRASRNVAKKMEKHHRRTLHRPGPPLFFFQDEEGLLASP